MLLYIENMVIGFLKMDADYESSLDSLEAMVNDISAFKRMSEIYVDNINNKY